MDGSKKMVNKVFLIRNYGLYLIYLAWDKL